MIILDDLNQGHNHTLDRLSHIEPVALDLDKGIITPNDWKRLVTFSEYLGKDVCLHFEKEEKILFPAMEKYIGRAGFIHAMLDEHRSFWRAVDTLEERMNAFNMSEGVNSTILRSIGQVLTHIIAYLRSHITKEEKSFFPLARNTLDASSVLETEMLLNQMQSNNK